MRRLQEQARWLAAEHIVLRRRDQLVGRIRLAALELLDRKRTAEVLDMLAHPGLKPGNVEAVLLANLGGSRKLLLPARHQPLSRATARQPMSRRQKPSGQSSL